MSGSAKLHDTSILDSPWNSVDLIKCLIKLMVNEDIKEYVREFFGVAIQNVPEIILISLAQINVIINYLNVNNNNNNNIE